MAHHGRGGKSRTPQYPQDLFALGSKPSRIEPSDNKRPVVVHGKSGPSHSLPGQDRKRDAVTVLPPIIPPKKPKILGGPVLGRAPSIGSSGGAEAWEMVAMDCEPSDLVPLVKEACDLDEGDRVVGLLCGAIRSIRGQRWKPDPILYLGLMYLAKMCPSLFSGDCVDHALCSLLRRDSSHNFKSKGNPLVPVLAANLLLQGYQDKKSWPENFIKLYVEDSLGDRVWVDQEACAGFVNNILTGINSRKLPRSLLQCEFFGMPACPSPSTLIADDDSGEGSSCITEGGLTMEGDKIDVSVHPRYANSQRAVEQIVMDAVKDQLNRRQPAENITRNFLRLMCTACGLIEVRLAAVPRLELWFQNPKLMKPAQELLMSVCVNCNTHTQRDVEVISHLVKIRLKTKSLISLYLSCIRELIQAHPDNLATVLKHTIYNELSNARNPNNMAMLSVIFQHAPDSAATLLADIFLELLMNQDDYLRPLRALLREVVRVLRHDINLLGFCRGLMERRDDLQQFKDFTFKERMFVSVTDLIALSVFLAISPAVREAASLLARGERREVATLNNFQMQVANIQREAVWWLHDTVPKMYVPSATEFVHALHKILFVEHMEQYYNKDMWPPECDRVILFRLASEVPLLQNTLTRILVIGLSKDNALAPPDALELVDQLLRRSAALNTDSFPMLQTDKLEIIDLIFNLCTYHHPEKITLPQGYCPPELAITNSYWKAWIMLLILSVYNPTTFGSVAWEKYPTLRTLMEMCITNHFSYPPPTITATELIEDTRCKELQIIAQEKQQILEFESYLAAASTKQTITEQTSLLLPQLITMDPTGPPRRPPQAVLDQLQTLNVSLRMGHLLCRSRRPDFLLDIIQRQGASQSMPWLADLVENSEGSLSHLPVQCLCEFLLSSSDAFLQPEKQTKHQQLLSHLQNLLMSPQVDPQVSCEILEYFLRRLSSQQTASRTQAIKGLKLVLSPLTGDDEPMDLDGLESNGDTPWLLRQLPMVPHFSVLRPQVVQALRQACQVENDPMLVSNYICFLALHTQLDALTDLADLVLDMAQLIVERSSIVAAILPAAEEGSLAASTQHAFMLMFCSYLQKVREPRREAYTWSESQDQILVTWSSGEECTMHILVVHAMIILLTYGPGQDPKLFTKLLDVWFPVNTEPPKAYLVDTSEEALLIPDWLKLKMIRSKVERLVDAALIDLDPPQLVLFIQSFGIHVQSMSKLLHTLDRAVTLNRDTVGEAVLDKNYMAQLVEVQHKRGATGGDILVQVLQLEPQQFPKTPKLPPTPVRPALHLISSARGKQPFGLINPRHAVEVWQRIFFHSTALAKEDFRFLQNIIAGEVRKTPEEWYCTRELIRYIQDECLSIRAKTFTQSLVTRYELSCPLLRLMSLVATRRKVPALVNCMVTVSRVLLSNITDQKSPLVDVLKNILEKSIKPRRRSSEPKMKITSQHDPLNVLESARIEDLEKAGNSLLQLYLKENKIQELVEAVTKLLLKESSKDVPKGYVKRVGLLVDWLDAIELELIGSNPHLQMNLLFGKSMSKQSCRPYLLTLLVHRASWSTLYSCVEWLLQKPDEQYDPTAVLDFLNALTYNPKLWQGREKTSSKYNKLENVLGLNINQVLNVVYYILEESANLNEEKSEEKTTSAVLEKMETRLPLVLQFLSEDPEIRTVTRYLVDQIRNKPRSGVTHQFCLQLYLNVPGLKRHLDDNESEQFFDKIYVTDWSRSSLDVISHMVLTALTAMPQGKDWIRRSQEYELHARKMASAHPALVLRQLPMLAASLRGRAHLGFNVFRSRGHLNLFQQVMGILELLQPHVFQKEHDESFADTLDCYFTVFQHHPHVKELIPLLSRLVTFLQAFISHDAHRALKYLQKHAHILNELQAQHPNFTLLSSIFLPNTDDESGELLVTIATATPQIETAISHASLQQIISRLRSEDASAALQDLDNLSSRKPAILDSFIETISDMLHSPSSNIRNTAYTLLARYFKYDPRKSTNGLAYSAYVRCLDSTQPEVLNSALEKLPEIVVSAQEKALPLLRKVCSLGIHGNMSTMSYLTKTISLLNLQNGY